MRSLHVNFTQWYLNYIKLIMIYVTSNNIILFRVFGKINIILLKSV